MAGSMTPSHGDGSMTPRTGAWDPMVTNTPARQTDFDYNLDADPSPSPGYYSIQSIHILNYYYRRFFYHYLILSYYE